MTVEEIARLAQRMADQMREQLIEAEARVMTGEFSRAAQADPWGTREVVFHEDPTIIEGEIVSVGTVRWPETLRRMLKEAGVESDGRPGSAAGDAPV